MRFDGNLRYWNDGRGFGFIEPTQGGQEKFVHIKAFESRSARPEIGLHVTFEVELNAEGKKHARRVQVRRAVHATKPGRGGSPAQWGTASYFAIPAFLVLYLVTAVVWRVPGWVAGLYVALSVCLVANAVDKSAAVAGRWRLSESVLLSLGLAGGRPGAIVAQQVLRHKSNKVEFRSAFWGRVVLNIVAFVAFNSPLRSVLRM